ncbi:MAG: hypothetical protein E7582_06780 [Ruminococcaceae bacterium]|nr:hypothetical protein [Oscillospiraceae bacterium]
MKFTVKSIIYIIITFVGVGIIMFSTKNEAPIQIISLVAAILSVVLLGAEIYMSRKITEAGFLADLNTSFVTNEDYKKAYSMFENYDFDSLPDLDMENIHISNYLTFFEIFQLLIDRGTLTIEMLDNLFGYRFFIAVHNPYVQKMKLVKSPENFVNLYILEKAWIEHRKKKGSPIFHEEYALSNMIDKERYQKIINKKF